MTLESVKWAAEISHVREVSLRGTADLAFWTDRLQSQGLVPAATKGKAQILIIAADMKFLGVRFREVSFSVVVERPPGVGGSDAAFLVQAFNSFHLFAFSERFLFSTPYRHGEIRISHEVPCSLELILKGNTVFRAEMNANVSSSSRQLERRRDESWSGPIFLPYTRVARDRKGKAFIARLRGDTERFRHLKDADSLQILPAFAIDVLQALVDSHFAAEEWLVRPDATHSKSKTYSRSDLPR